MIARYATSNRGTAQTQYFRRFCRENSVRNRRRARERPICRNVGHRARVGGCCCSRSVSGRILALAALRSRMGPWGGFPDNLRPVARYGARAQRYAGSADEGGHGQSLPRPPVLGPRLMALRRNGQVHGQTSESIVAKLLEKPDGADEPVPPEQLSIAKDVGFAAYEGKPIASYLHRTVLMDRTWLAGADTVSLLLPLRASCLVFTSDTDRSTTSTQTSSTLKTFFLAMCLYPDVQKRAQAELDAVVGTGRLPDHADRRSLPYVDALVKETIRWQPAAPLALPHVSIEDVEYDGYFIPAGTILFANSW